MPIRDHKPHRTGAAERLADFYGPEELRLAQAIYERDFTELGYDLDLENLTRHNPPARPDPSVIKAWGRACRLMGEHDFAGAEREFVALKPWISGVAIEEQLLHCRCELGGSDRATLEQGVGTLERALARGQEEWSVWKWYGHGLVKLGRWEDGLRAMLTATERQPGGNHKRKRIRRLVWRLALLHASKGRLQEALKTLADDPTTAEGATSPRLHAVSGWLQRLAVRIVAAGAVVTGASRWHPDRVMGIPRSGDGPQPQGVATGG